MFKGNIEEILKRSTGLKEVNLELPENESFGDYSTNLTLHQKNPRQTAEEIVKKLQGDKELGKIVEKIEVAGPGFINFWLSKQALAENLKEVAKKKDKYGTSEVGRGKTVVIDYSSPNIAKRFSIGHLRSTVIGQALYNLYGSLGYKVIGDNHLGDWGTQFGTLLYQINTQHLTVSNLTIDKLEELYVDFHKKAEESPELWDKAREWFKRLEEKDVEARGIWKDIVDISIAEFNRIYELLGIKIDYAYGESFYEDKMSEVIEELRKRDLAKKSEGAEIVEFSDLPPAMLVKSDGTTTYFTRDLATVKFRLREWNPDLFIYEVGIDQALHFRQLFETVHILGWASDKEFVHVAHGLIRFAGGKMSTRHGTTVKLEEVLNEAIERAGKIIGESETGRGLDDKEKKDVAQKVGIGAVKYFDLSHHPTSDIIFNWEKMFVMEGNSGPYLQYTVARTNSVLAKSTNKQIYKSTNINNETVKQLNNEELLVLRSLVRFSEVIASAAKNYSPNLLANYLFDLAQKYNNFYNQHRILGSANLELRIMLTEGAGQVLKNGLSILGIQTPERM